MEGFFRNLVKRSGGRMFGSNMDSGPDAVVVPGTMVFPTRFVWKHGGNSVFLCGNFTQWVLKKCSVFCICFPTQDSYVWNLYLILWKAVLSYFSCIWFYLKSFFFFFGVKVVAACANVASGGLRQCVSGCVRLNARILSG